MKVLEFSVFDLWNPHMGQVNQLFGERDERWLRDDTVLWRYVPLRTVFFYLSGLIFIPSLAKLRNNDPFEGEFFEEIAWFNKGFHDFHGRNAVPLEKWIEDNLCSKDDLQFIEINRTEGNAPAKIYRKHYFDLIRRTRFAWCWFQSGRESAAMWSTYGNQGVAVQTTVGKLRALFQKSDRDFIVSPMIYVDSQMGRGRHFNPEESSDQPLLLRPYFLKRHEYESEKEVRFVTVGPEREYRGGILLRNQDCAHWISAIRLWPGLTDEEADSIAKIVRQFLPECDCALSDLFSRPDAPSGALRRMVLQWEDGRDSAWSSNHDDIHSEFKRP